MLLHEQSTAESFGCPPKNGEGVGDDEGHHASSGCAPRDADHGNDASRRSEDRGAASEAVIDLTGDDNEFAFSDSPAKIGKHKR